jgi:hypothetical protein
MSGVLSKFFPSLRLGLFAGLVGGVSFLFPVTGQSATWTPDPSLGDPAQHLKIYNIGRRSCDEHYDDSVGLFEKDPGKHRNYMVRESAYYAYGLLLTGDPEDRKRAEKIIRVVLTTQDLKKDRLTYGCFPSLFEDKWETVVNPDLNYCQFVGMALGQIIDLDRKQGRVLPEDLRKQLETSFRLAVEATIRRDVDPGYTNISLLSAAVGAAGEKLLGVPGAADFAMSKLSWFLARAQPGTSIREYLAPTYFGVDLGAAYTVKIFACAPALADAADRTITALWKDVATSYHAPTMQLAGPHSRAYGENMLEYAAGLKYFLYFAMDGKYPLSDAEAKQTWDTGWLVSVANLPVTVRPEFQGTPVPWREVSVAGGNGMVFRQYREGDFILGSISTQSLWQQQRSVVAYWPVTTPAWHVGFCMDMSAMTMGNGYAHFYSVQSKGAVLAAITGEPPVPQKGGLRFGFNGGAQAQELAGGAAAYVVYDGDVTTYIYPVTLADGRMTIQTERDRVYVDRPWSSADPASGFHVLSYLVVFQLPGEAVPVVKNLAMKVTEPNTTVSAEVNGTPLFLQIASVVEAKFAK